MKWKTETEKDDSPISESLLSETLNPVIPPDRYRNIENPFIFDKFLALPEVFIYPRLLFPSDFLSVFKIDVVPIPKLFQRLRQISFFSLVHETNLLSSGFYLFNLSGLADEF